MYNYSLLLTIKTGYGKIIFPLWQGAGKNPFISDIDLQDVRWGVRSLFV